MYSFKKFLFVSLLTLSFNNVFSTGDDSETSKVEVSNESSTKDSNATNFKDTIKNNLGKFFSNYVKNKKTYGVAILVAAITSGYYLGKYNYDVDFNNKINDFAKKLEQKIKNGFEKVKNNPGKSFLATFSVASAALGYYIWQNMDSK